MWTDWDGLRVWDYWVDEGLQDEIGGKVRVWGETQVDPWRKPVCVCVWGGAR